MALDDLPSLIPRYDPLAWLAIAVLALQLSWLPLTWAKPRRQQVVRCIAGLGVLVAGLGLSWLIAVGSAIRAILDAMPAWHRGSVIGHLGFEYVDYDVLLDFAQVGLGILALGLAMLVRAAAATLATP